MQYFNQIRILLNQQEFFENYVNKSMFFVMNNQKKDK